MAALGLDRSWVKRALCLQWSEDQKPSPWQVDKGQTIDGVRGAEMIKMALMVCRNCPVQYECARYAVKGNMRAGTWAMGITNLKWLQRMSEEQAMQIIDQAEEQGESLDVSVTQARRSISIVT